MANPPMEQKLTLSIKLTIPEMNKIIPILCPFLFLKIRVIIAISIPTGIVTKESKNSTNPRLLRLSFM
jgi:hypothetical protein